MSFFTKKTQTKGGTFLYSGHEGKSKSQVIGWSGGGGSARSADASSILNITLSENRY